MKNELFQSLQHEAQSPTHEDHEAVVVGNFAAAGYSLEELGLADLPAIPEDLEALLSEPVEASPLVLDNQDVAVQRNEQDAQDDSYNLTSSKALPPGVVLEGAYNPLASSVGIVGVEEDETVSIPSRIHKYWNR
jgi:hypothetical protein